jgi:RNA-directed DNA polymerase
MDKMNKNKLAALRQIRTKPELADLLGLKAQFLTHVLYRLKPATQYTSFTINKKSGGTRTIFAPSSKLKTIQSSLSKLLLDCIDEINEKKKKKSTYKRALSHGFARECSIITNAMLHLGKKNVLNIDLKDFFDSFNFGRVRGFFIKNEHFKLDPDIATVIAQIACYDNKLPQGSPCSPVITNLITHSLDIKLASLANRHSCTYSRYADDMTFSTRKSTFPSKIMKEDAGEYVAGKVLRNEIKRAGFQINETKTRILYKDSRQDVTGLIVNKKPNVKKEYWRTVKSQCNKLFHTGSFTKKVDGEDVDGNINELEGQLKFIDQIDKFNRSRKKPPLNQIYKIASHGINKVPLLSGREKTFGKFLYYKLFYGNTEPTILCEGKTDNVYLKSAIHQLVKKYPKLASFDPKKPKSEAYKLLINFVKYTKRTKFLNQLHGGTPYLSFFLTTFEKHYDFYKAPKPKHPVIIILDNDSGSNEIVNKIQKIKQCVVYPKKLKKSECHKAKYIHVFHNLYIVLTPLGKNDEPTDIEYFFKDKDRLKNYKGKHFNTVANRDPKKDLSKDSFAEHIVRAQKKDVDFSGFTTLLNRLVLVIKHYEKIK